MESRFDPSYYQPAFQEAVAVLRAGKYPLSTIDELCEDMIHPAEFPREYADEQRGLPFVRAGDVRDGCLNLTGLPFVAKDTLRGFPQSRLRVGDVLVVRTGAKAGEVAMFAEPEGEFFASSHTLLLRAKIGVNPRYLEQFLASRFGKEQLLRCLTGAAQKQLQKPTVASIRIPLLPRSVQDAIADKMDAAYRRKRELEAEARALLESINGYVLGELGIELPEVKDESHFAQRASTVRTGRLNPEYYHPERMAALTVLSKGRYPCQPLRAVVRFRRKSVAACQEAPDTPYIGLEHIESNTGELTTGNLPHGRDIDSRATVFEAGDVLFPRLRPYLNKVHLARFDGLCSTGFHILRTRENCHPAYLKEFLLTSAIVNQTKRMMTGNTLPRLQASDIEILQIPLPPLETQHEIAAEAQARRERARALREEAQRVVTEAKAQVERMILGAT